MYGAPKKKLSERDLFFREVQRVNCEYISEQYS